MDLRSYLRAIRKSWWIVLLVAVLCGGGEYVLSKRATPIYAAHVSFYVSTPLVTDQNAMSTDQFAQARANSYAQLLSSDELGQMVVDSTGLKLTKGDVAAKITGAAHLNTVFVDATIKDSSTGRALQIATAVSTDLPVLVDDLDNRSGEAAAVTVKAVSGPNVDAAPISPRTKLNTGLALVLGLFLGLLAAVLRFLLDTSVRSAEMLREVAGAPVVGTIGFDAAARKSPLVVGEAARSLRAEAFRQLRTNLLFIDAARPVNVIVVTSSVEGEGKSSTAANVALVFAESGRSVLLVEADLRRPKVADYLSLERAVGLTNVLAGQVTVDEVLQPWGSNGLTVLPSGSVPPNPSELLGGEHMATLITELRARFDIIIIDTPPLLPVTDAAVLSTRADGVLVIFRYGKTKRGQLTTAMHSLQSVNARVLGCVLNMRPLKGPDGASYGGYGYYQDEPKKSRPGSKRRSEPAAQATDGDVLVGASTAGRSAINEGDPALDAGDGGAGAAHGVPEIDQLRNRRWRTRARHVGRRNVGDADQPAASGRRI